MFKQIVKQAEIPTKNIGVTKIQLDISGEYEFHLETICKYSNNVHNRAVFVQRQNFFFGEGYLGKFDLINAVTKADSEWYSYSCKYLYSQAAQQSVITVFEAFSTYKEGLRLHKVGELSEQPKLPGYRKRGGLQKVTYPAQNLTYSEGYIKIPLGVGYSQEYEIDALYLPFPSHIDKNKIKEVSILPQNGKFFLEISVGKELVPSLPDYSKVYCIDPGLNNALSVMSNFGDSFIVDGRQAKSINQLYNKKISEYKTGKDGDFWDEYCDYLTLKRNNTIRDWYNKAAKLFIERCLANNVGIVGFGWNSGFKDAIKLGRKSNQSFTQLPLAKLRDAIKNLCILNNILFYEIDESYSSKSSFLDGDLLPLYGAKPISYKFSGRRIRRGLYKSQFGICVNADIHGAVNLIRRLSQYVNIDLSGITIQSLRSATRLFVWKKKDDKNARSTNRNVDINCVKGQYCNLSDHLKNKHLSKRSELIKSKLKNAN